MHSDTKAFIRKGIVIPAILGATIGSVQLAHTPPVLTATATASANPTAAAMQQVEQQTNDLTRGLTCWDDPAGHQPTLAVVKDDGGTTAYTLTADQAWDAAHDGDVWVLAWCAPKARS